MSGFGHASIDNDFPSLCPPCPASRLAQVSNCTVSQKTFISLAARCDSSCSKAHAIFSNLYETSPTSRASCCLSVCLSVFFGTQQNHTSSPAASIVIAHIGPKKTTTNGAFGASATLESSQRKQECQARHRELARWGALLTFSQWCACCFFDSLSALAPSNPTGQISFRLHRRRTHSRNNAIDRLLPFASVAYGVPQCRYLQVDKALIL